MIPLNFYRDDNYVYYNNPNGITKKMTIADFEAMMSGESELPTYSSSNNGEVLSVDANGDLDWASLPPAELPAYTSSDGGKVLAVNSGGTGVEWGEVSSDAVFYVNGEITELEDNPGHFTFDTEVTLADIISAYESNKVLILVNTSGTTDAGFGCFYLKSAYVSDEFNLFLFTNSIEINDSIGSISFGYTSVSVSDSGWQVSFIVVDVVKYTQS